jgi:DNA-binding NarL/FixJ family response regulator
VTACRVALVDDHALVRAGLRALLAGIPGVEVVGEAGDGHAALELVARLGPRIVLLDLALPGLSGLELAARIAKSQPETRIVVLSMHTSEEYVLQALRAGAAGYVVKDASADELALAVRAVLGGKTYLSPAISQRVVDAYLHRSAGAAAEPAELTPRQREILQLVAEGESTKAIAGKLGVSVKTVETHRAQLMERFGIRDLAGLVRYAVRTGLVSPERRGRGPRMWYGAATMMARTQITLDPELHRRARRRASERGVSFAEYVPRLLAADLGPRRRRAEVAAVFALGSSGGSDVARDKDPMLGAAAEAGARRRRRRA